MLVASVRIEDCVHDSLLPIRIRHNVRRLQTLQRSILLDQVESSHDTSLKSS